MDYTDFVYKQWQKDVLKGNTNLSFEEYFEFFTK